MYVIRDGLKYRAKVRTKSQSGNTGFTDGLRFENFDLRHLDRMIVVANPLDSKNKRNNQERYVRIAFDSLDDFLAKDNRKNYFLINETSQELNPIIFAIKNKNYELADKKLKELIKEVSIHIYQLESGIKPYEFQMEDYPRMVAEDSNF